MNISLENAVYCDQKGLQYKLDNYAIRFRQILYIQIPDEVSFFYLCLPKLVPLNR